MKKVDNRLDVLHIGEKFLLTDVNYFLILIMKNGFYFYVQIPLLTLSLLSKDQVISVVTTLYNEDSFGLSLHYHNCLEEHLNIKTDIQKVIYIL